MILDGCGLFLLRRLTRLSDSLTGKPSAPGNGGLLWGRKGSCAKSVSRRRRSGSEEYQEVGETRSESVRLGAQRRPDGCQVLPTLRGTRCRVVVVGLVGGGCAGYLSIQV